MADEEMLLRPTGWASDPAEERFKLSVIDCVPTCTYNHYVLFWRLADDAKAAAVDVLRRGLARTLSQARHLCGTIEPDPAGGHSFVKRRESAVPLRVRRYDAAGQAHRPSMDDMVATHFAQRTLGDLGDWGLPHMTWGDRPEADPDRRPAVAAFQASLVRGGLVLSMQSHHYASDVMGWANFTAQLADNCRAAAHGTPPPPWDPANLDVARFTRAVPPAAQVDGPPAAARHPGHPPQQAVLFHLPASRAARLKARAAAAARDPPAADGAPAGASVPWISTYDAMCAFVWRALTRVRARRYRPAPDAPLWWGEAVDMRPRLRRPPVPARMLRNVVAGAFSDAAPLAPPTVAAVAGAPGEALDDAAALGRLARYVRALTAGCTEAHLERLVAQLAPVRDKRRVSLRVDAHPPLSVFVTDHRPAGVAGRDFGFGAPLTHRHMWGDGLTPGLVLIYPPVRGEAAAAGPDEGCTFTVTMEADLVPALCADPVWCQYFEYRGVD